MRTALLVILVAAALSIGGWSKYSTVKADLAAQREGIDSEWSLVDVALERRAELILKMDVPESLRQECAVLAGAKTPSEKIDANTRISAGLAQLSRRESDGLTQRLSDAENRIAVERRRYNEMLEHYNAQIQRFPDNIVASIAGFQRDDAYLPTDAGTQH